MCTSHWAGWRCGTQVERPLASPVPESRGAHGPTNLWQVTGPPGRAGAVSLTVSTAPLALCEGIGLEWGYRSQFIQGTIKNSDGQGILWSPLQTNNIVVAFPWLTSWNVGERNTVAQWKTNKLTQIQTFKNMSLCTKTNKTDRIPKLLVIGSFWYSQ